MRVADIFTSASSIALMPHHPPALMLHANTASLKDMEHKERHNGWRKEDYD